MPILFLTVVVDLIGFGIIIPILPFMAPQFGATTADIFIITAVYSVATALMNPVWGKLSDRFGRKPILLICLGGACLSYIWLAFCTSLLMVYICRVFAGAMAGNFGVASAAVADMTTLENRAKGMGMIGAAFGLGMSAGPLIGGVLSGPEADFVVPALVAAGLSAVAIILGAIFLEEPLTPEKRALYAKQKEGKPSVSIIKMLKETGNTFLASQYFLQNTCVSLMTAMFPIWVGFLLDWSPKQVGYVLCLQGFSMAVVQGTLVGPLSKRLGEVRFLLFGITLICIGCLASSFAQTPVAVLITFTTGILGATFCTPMLNTITTKRTPAHYRGRMLGTTASMGALGRVFGPLMGAWITPTFGFSATWIFMFIIGLLFSIWAINELRLEKQAKAAC